MKTASRRFTKRELAKFRAKLEARNQKLMETEKGLEEEALVGLSGEATDEISHIRLHPADLATSESDQDLDLHLAAAEVTEMQDVEEALMRIQNEEFGNCEECGREIAVARLEAVPSTRYCGECEQKFEMEAKRRRDGHAFEIREKVAP